MKQLYIIIFSIFLLFTNLSAQNTKEKTSLKIAFGANKPPFMFQLGTNSGLEFDIIKEVFKLKGFEVEPLQLTYQKLSTALKDNQSIDGAAGVQKNPNDPFYYSDNYIVFNNYAYTKKSDNIKLTTFHDLKGYKIAIWGDGHKHLGNEFFNLFNPDARKTHTPKFYEINNQEEQVASLFDGIADIVIIDKKIFYWHKNSISDTLNTNIELVEHKLFEDATGFNVTFRDDKINSIFNSGLKELKENGRYQEIVDNYADQNFQFFINYINTIAQLVKPLIIEDDIDAINTVIDETSQLISPIRSITVKDRFNKDISFYQNDSYYGLSYNRIKHSIFQQNLSNNITNSIGEIVITYYNKQPKQYLPDLLKIVNSSTNLNQFQKKNILNNITISKNNGISLQNFEFTKKEKDWIKNNPTINYVIDPNWAPFEFTDKNGNHTGITSEFLDIVQEKTGINFIISPTESWKNSVEKVNNKQSDMLTLLKETKKRKNSLNFSVPYANYPFVIVAKNDKNFIFNTSALNGKKVVVVDKYSITEHLKEDYSKINLIYVKDIYEALLKVSNEEAYAYIDILPTIAYNITHGGFTNLKIIGETEYKLPLSIALRKELGETGITIINKVLNSISIEERNNIFQKWINIEIEQKTDYTLAIKTAMILILLLLAIILWNRKLANEINKRKIAEKELLEFKNGLFVNSKAVMLLINPKDGKIVDCNNSALNYYGYSYNELTNMSIYQINQLSQEEIKIEMNKAAKEKRDNFNFKHKLKNAQIRDVEVHSGPILINGEQLLYSIIHDITEQKKQENFINEQSKLASMGEMIANIAHQWRQPLSIISTSAGGAKIEKEMGQLDDNEFYNFMDNIIDQTEYLSDTIDDFRNFIKNDRNQVEFTLESIVEKFLHLMQGSLKTNNIIIVKSIQKNLTLYSYPNELIQCMINIYNNSKDALNETNDDKYFFIDIKAKGNDVILTFKDNAGGIPKDTLSRVFEPYFTTKHQYQGTGLGLSMTYKIITDGMNGKIKIRNTSFEYNNSKYNGAECIIILPLKDK